jgi:hypothetical protein
VEREIGIEVEAYDHGGRTHLWTVKSVRSLLFEALECGDVDRFACADGELLAITGLAQFNPLPCHDDIAHTFTFRTSAVGSFAINTSVVARELGMIFCLFFLKKPLEAILFLRLEPGESYALASQKMAIHAAEG